MQRANSADAICGRAEHELKDEVEHRLGSELCPELALCQRPSGRWDLPNFQDMKVMIYRTIFWVVSLGYTGFLLTGQGLRTFNRLSISEACLGALTGLLLAIMFTLRERRRQRPAFVTYPIEQLFPDWGIPIANRGLNTKRRH